MSQVPEVFLFANREMALLRGLARWQRRGVRRAIVREQLAIDSCANPGASCDAQVRPKGKAMLRDDSNNGSGRRPAPRNVLGEPLEICSINPMSGFYRDGCCNTGREDIGSHTVCAVMTAAFLEFSKSRGNDLSTPLPEVGFPGLKPGDRWCLCAPRWQEAFEANQAPRVVLRATHQGASGLLLARRPEAVRRGLGVTARLTRAGLSLQICKP